MRQLHEPHLPGMAGERRTLQLDLRPDPRPQRAAVHAAPTHAAALLPTRRRYHATYPKATERYGGAHERGWRLSAAVGRAVCDVIVGFGLGARARNARKRRGTDVAARLPGHGTRANHPSTCHAHAPCRGTRVHHPSTCHEYRSDTWQVHVLTEANPYHPSRPRVTGAKLLAPLDVLDLSMTVRQAPRDLPRYMPRYTPRYTPRYAPRVSRRDTRPRGSRRDGVLIGHVIELGCHQMNDVVMNEHWRGR